MTIMVTVIIYTQSHRASDPEFLCRLPETVHKTGCSEYRYLATKATSGEIFMNHSPILTLYMLYRLFPFHYAPFSSICQ